MFKPFMKNMINIICLWAITGPVFARDTTATMKTGSQSIGHRDIAVMKQTWLDAHNEERARFGYTPLKWHEALANDAAKYAAEMARTEIFEHSNQTNAIYAQGENLWMGSTGAYSDRDMVEIWVNERSHFLPGTFPYISKTGNWADIGHYTQMIWPDTKYVGCALSGNLRDEYFVCRYYPAGNVLGEKIGVK